MYIWRTGPTHISLLLFTYMHRKQNVVSQSWGIFFVSSCRMCDVEMSVSASCLSLLWDSIDSIALYSNSYSTIWSHRICRCDMWLFNNPLCCCSFFPWLSITTFRKGTRSSIDYRLCQLWWSDMTLSLCICFLRFILKGQNRFYKTDLLINLIDLRVVELYCRYFSTHAVLNVWSAMSGGNSQNVM